MSVIGDAKYFHCQESKEISFHRINLHDVLTIQHLERLLAFFQDSSDPTATLILLQGSDFASGTSIKITADMRHIMIKMRSCVLIDGSYVHYDHFESGKKENVLPSLLQVIQYLRE